MFKWKLSVGSRFALYLKLLIVWGFVTRVPKTQWIWDKACFRKKIKAESRNKIKLKRRRRWHDWFNPIELIYGVFSRTILWIQRMINLLAYLTYWKHKQIKSLSTKLPKRFSWWKSSSKCKWTPYYWLTRIFNRISILLPK